jgi:hypothetical protein
MNEMVAHNQSAFIMNRAIHDNFRTVQLACRWLYSKKFPSLLLKVDIAKAFDSVGWPFLLEVLQHLGFPVDTWTGSPSSCLLPAPVCLSMEGRDVGSPTRGGCARVTPFPRCYSCSLWRY